MVGDYCTIGTIDDVEEYYVLGKTDPDQSWLSWSILTNVLGWEYHYNIDIALRTN